MSFKFLINKLMFPDEDNIVLPEGFNIELFTNEIPKICSTDKAFLFGTLQDASIIREGIYCETSDFDVSSWLEILGDDGMNYNDSYYKLSCQLKQSDVGKFIRSNSGRKVLTGQILDKTLFSQIQQRTHPYISPNDMLFLAPAKTGFDVEYRLWVVEDEIVASSAYTWDKTHKVNNIRPPKMLLEKANHIISRYSPGVAYVMDMGWEDYSGYKVIEYNGFSTSGFYDVPLKSLLTAVCKYCDGWIYNIKDGFIDLDPEFAKIINDNFMDLL